MGTSPIRLAIDAMGNDNGPPPVIRGVRDFLAVDKDTTVVLVGDRARLEPAIAAEGIPWSPRIELVHASQVMEMGDKVSGLREKRDSSIMRLAAEVKEGRADAMVALGNTAAAVGAATIMLRLLHGVRRPGIAVPVPTRVPGRPCVVLDMGANTVCKPSHLLAYGVMASLYAERVLGIENPRVGLLNVGEERGKGNEALREAFQLLESAPVNFVGNVEGTDIFSGTCDVAVCDGFLGNVVLKAIEGMAGAMGCWLKESLTSSWRSRLGAWLAGGALREMKRRGDYAAYGGAPLLGVNGVCIIGHGRSTSEAVMNALRVARESVRERVNERIRDSLAAFSSLHDTASD